MLQSTAAPRATQKRLIQHGFLSLTVLHQPSTPGACSGNSVFYGSGVYQEDNLASFTEFDPRLHFTSTKLWADQYVVILPFAVSGVLNTLFETNEKNTL